MAEVQKPKDNRISQGYDLKGVLDVFKRDLLLGMNCHAVGTVKSFNASNQTLSAIINYQKTYLRVDQETKKYKQELVSYPVLIDCPTICLFGGAYSMRFPIAAGDTCLIFFNDRDIDTWFSSGNTNAPPATPRLHAISDGIALVGLRSAVNSLSAYDTTAFEVTDGTRKVKLTPTVASIENNDKKLTLGANSVSLEKNTTTVVQLTSADKVKIANAATTLLTVIEGLMDLLTAAFNTATPTPGNPLNAAAATAITTYKAQVEALLE